LKTACPNIEPGIKIPAAFRKKDWTTSTHGRSDEFEFKTGNDREQGTKFLGMFTWDSNGGIIDGRVGSIRVGTFQVTVQMI
jgi:hypothetical protein